MKQFAYIALIFGVAQAHKLNREDFITDEQYAEQHAHAMYQKDHPMEDDLDDDHMVQLKSDFITDDQYAVVQAKAMYEKLHPMADEEDEDHLIQLNKEDFITDDQYAAFHAKKVYDKVHYMNDDQDEDHLLQTETKIQFVTDDQWQYIAAKKEKMGKAAKNMPDDIEDDHLLDQTEIQFVDDAQWQFISHDYLQTQKNDFMSDDEYRAFHAHKMEQKYNDKNMPDWIEDDHLVQTHQGYVELPNCAANQYGVAAADPSRPQITGNNEKDGLDHANSDATCKPGTEWTNTVEAAAPPTVVPKASGLGSTRPY